MLGVRVEVGYLFFCSRHGGAGVPGVVRGFQLGNATASSGQDLALVGWSRLTCLSPLVDVAKKNGGGIF